MVTCLRFCFLNNELIEIESGLSFSEKYLNAGGRIVSVTFHSLEDRIAKTFFRNGSFSETEADEVYGTRPESPFLIISKKPIVPGETELKQNPRSRSAKLRVAELK